MLGYSIYNKSINGIKTISDGKVLISNGIISSCDEINTKKHNCDNMTLTDGLRIVSNNEFLTLDGIDITKSIQQQLNDLYDSHGGNSGDIENLQNQINDVVSVNNSQQTSINTINNTSIPNLQNQIDNITTVNNSQQTSINTINNTSIPNLQNQIDNVVSVNNSQTTAINSLNNIVIPNMQSQITNNENEISAIQYDLLTNTNNLQTQINNVITVNNSQQTSITNLQNNSVYTINTNLTEPSNSSLSATKTGNTYTLNVGIPRNLKFIGNWNDTDPPYKRGDLVRYDGSVYFCNKDNVNSTSNPSSNTNDWDIFCEKGQDGQDGSDGSDGSDGESGLDALLTALGVIGALGVIVPMTLATLTNRLNQIPDLENDVNDLENDVGNQDGRIDELERITKYQDSLNNVKQTSFNSDILIKYTDPITDETTTKIVLDQSSGNITCATIEPNYINVNHNVYVAENLTALGNINLGTSAISTVNINSLNTNINGFLTINNVPFGFDTSGFFSQW